MDEQRLPVAAAATAGARRLAGSKRRVVAFDEEAEDDEDDEEGGDGSGVGVWDDGLSVRALDTEAAVAAESQAAWGGSRGAAAAPTTTTGPRERLDRQSAALAVLARVAVSETEKAAAGPPSEGPACRSVARCAAPPLGRWRGWADGSAASGCATPGAFGFGFGVRVA